MPNLLGDFTPRPGRKECAFPEAEWRSELEKGKAKEKRVAQIYAGNITTAELKMVSVPPSVF